MNRQFDFKNVPNKYRPVPFWSWNEKLNTDETSEQIDKMQSQGIGGFFMHARGGLETRYMEDEWFENIRTCADKCKENKMLPWAYDENGWPSGFGNGIVNGKGEEYCQKYLRFEKGKKTSERTVANVDGYHFYYDVNPFYVDTLDAKVTDVFLSEIYTPYYERFKGKLEGFFTDEPQISRNGIPWSLILPEEYEKAYGEDLLGVLPHLFMESGNYKDTRVKFWKLITNLFSKNFMKKIYDWCHSHDFKLTGHLVLEEDLYMQLTANGACMPHYEYFSIPGMDWLGRDVFDSLTPYQVSSVAAQTGKDQVLSETFALCGHNIGHDELKMMFEFQMVRGITLLCQHLEGYSNRGIRKRDYPPAMYVQQPWWDEYKQFNDTMARTGMMLTGGDDCVDVLVIHPQTTAWTLYNDSEFYDSKNTGAKDKILQLHSEFMKVLTTLEKKHINFHLGDETLMERYASVDGGKLVIGKKKYSKVILPPHDVLFENTKKLLDEFKKCGGEITNVQQITENNIINIPEITYCMRKKEDHTVYYFVNSTENEYDAYIEKGAFFVDASTGEVKEFDGHFKFKKYSSVLVIDDGTERKEKKKEEKHLISLDLDGDWEVKNFTSNILTLDYCTYYFDGILQEENGYILNAMYRALDLERPVNIRCEFAFDADFIPDDLTLVIETPEIFDIKVNGNEISKKDAGYFIDKSFRRIVISEYAKQGKNTVSLYVDFNQNKTVYENIRKSKIFESEKNKLTFDMEIEQIYIIGNFSLKTDGEFENLPRNACRYNGNFVITEPTKKISLKDIQKQGFPFFAGSLTLAKEFEVLSPDVMLKFKKCGINVVKLKVNGKHVKSLMWEPFEADLSEYVNIGKNEIELTLVGNLRNMQGPFHLEEGESYTVVPASFFKEKCVWKPDEGNWRDDYCFAVLSVENPQQI